MVTKLRVLAAVDGSKHAEAAVEFLYALKFGEETEITLLTVVEPVRTIYAAGDPLLGPEVYRLMEEYLAAQEAEAAEYLSQLAARLREFGARTETLVLTGHPADEVVKVATERRADLVVMGARGLNPILSWLLGSVSHHVVRYAPCSVLVVKLRDGKAPIPSGHPWRILLAADPAPYSAFATDLVNRLPFSPDTEVRVLVVVQQLGRPKPEQAEVRQVWEAMAEAEERSAQALAERLAERLQARYPKAAAELRLGDPANEALKFAREWPADLVVVGARGTSARKDVPLGSVAVKILGHAPCPVLVARPPQFTPTST